MSAIKLAGPPVVNDVLGRAQPIQAELAHKIDNREKERVRALKRSN